MPKVEGIVSSQFSVKNNMLIIGSVPVIDIIRKHNTPLYVYDIGIIKNIYNALRQGLPDNTDLFYSIKANPNLSLCKLFMKLGAGAEVVSLGELDIALAAGFDNKKIVFSGPGKSEKELLRAVDGGLLSINVESITEIKDIFEICNKLGKKQVDISLRINPAENVSGSQMRMCGGPSQFGIDEEQLDEALILIRSLQSINLIGIHVYVGTQIHDYQAALKNIENVLSIVDKINSSFQTNLKLINLGGGFGIDYYRKDHPFDIKMFLKKFRSTIGNEAQYIIELGRFLTAPCGIYLTQIRYIKESKGLKFVIVDGGLNHNTIATSGIGQMVKKKFPIAVVNKMGCQATQRVTITGPLCLPLDTFGSQVNVPDLKRGDIIGVFYMGAYGLTASPVNFLSHPLCTEVIVDQNHFSLTESLC